MITTLYNKVSFSLRSRLPSIRHKPYSEKLKESLEQSFFPDEVALELSELSLRINLFYYWALSQLPWKAPTETVRVIDIGSKDFRYAPALALFLNERCKGFDLCGLEMDPYPVYYDLYSRGDCAGYYSRKAGELAADSGTVEYRAGNWLTHEEGNYDLVTCFYPFLYSSLHDRFGLPRDGFDPELFYRKVFSGSISRIFFHQGERELEDSLALLKMLGLPIAEPIELKGNPWLYEKHPTYALEL